MRQKMNEETIDKISKMAKTGATYREIAQKIKVSKSTVGYWCRKLNIQTQTTVDRTLCKECIYYCTQTHSCDYILLTLKMRDCDPHNCKEFVKGEFAGKLAPMKVNPQK